MTTSPFSITDSKHKRMNSDHQNTRNLTDVPEGYRCPLCPDHDDDEFEWNSLLKAPVCRGCSHDIFSLLADDKRIDDPVMDRLEEVTGLSFYECQVVYLQEEILHCEEALIKKRQEVETSPESFMDESEIQDYESRLWDYRRFLRNAKKHLKG